MASRQTTRPKLYQKPTKTSAELIQKLRDRGLLIPDVSAAETALTFIGYYRLSGYFIPYYKMTQERKPQIEEPKAFLPGITLENIIELWNDPVSADSICPHGEAFSKASGLTPPR